jgi:hypothetical protein
MKRLQGENSVISSSFKLCAPLKDTAGATIFISRETNQQVSSVTSPITLAELQVKIA